MRHKIFALLVAVATIAAPAAPVLARDAKQGPANSWEAVKRIGGGVRVVVRTKDGEKKEGHFESATDSVLVLRRDGKSVSFDRDKIRRVAYRGGRSRTKGALVGAAIGGGAGAGVGGGIYESADGDFIGAVVPIIALIGVGVGAGIGAAFGMGKKDVTVYESF